MKTLVVVRRNYYAPEYPFAVVMDDFDAGHEHPEEYDSAHTFPATADQLLKLRDQIDSALGVVA